MSHQPVAVVGVGQTHHKKRRAEVRARMARTHESYQRALARILAGDDDVDLLAIEYFGVPVALAIYDIGGRIACLVVSSSCHRGPFPGTPLHALRDRDVN